MDKQNNRGDTVAKEERNSQPGQTSAGIYFSTTARVLKH